MSIGKPGANRLNVITKFLKVFDNHCLLSQARFKVCNLDHSGIGIIVNHAVEKLLGNILINLLIRVVFPGHPEKYQTQSAGTAG